MPCHALATRLISQRASQPRFPCTVLSLTKSVSLKLHSSPEKVFYIHGCCFLTPNHTAVLHECRPWSVKVNMYREGGRGQGGFAPRDMNAVPVNVGDEIEVKCTEIDSQGRVNLSRKAVLQPGSEGEDSMSAGRGRDRDRGGRPHRPSGPSRPRS